MKKNSKIYVAGHKGLVGSAIVRALRRQGFKNLVLKTRAELDLLDQKAVRDFFDLEKPEYVFMAAAKVGGIMANSSHPGEFAFVNLEIQNNLIHSAYLSKVKKLLFLGSSCIYPRLSPQPMKEKHFMTGPLEPTNASYAIAKIAGIYMCQGYNKQYGTNFISIMPTNIYGEGDHFDLANSHVLSALIRRFHDAKESGAKDVTLWGTGSAKREFLYVDDLAEASIFMMQKYDSGDIVNIGTGKDISIKELAQKIKKIVGFKGKICWDSTKPDGMPRKLLNVSKLHKLGWKHKVDLEEGIKKTYAHFLKIK